MKNSAKSIKELIKLFSFCTLFIFCFSCCSTPANTTSDKTLDDYPVIEIPDSDVLELNPTVSSVEMAKNMIIGWNLGNTLDATAWNNADNAGLSTETGWGMPKTTESMISAVKAEGFKTSRIPVSWHNHISDTSNYKIDSTWMARVKQVVDWAYNQDMYVIINIHHDNLAESKLAGKCGFALSKQADIQAQSMAYIRNIWTQIAIEFASYDERLVFEVLNEPRDVDGEVTGNEWWCNQKSIMDIITSQEQVAINAIRAVPGNKNRFIMVPGYAASGSDGSMLALYTMPTDSAHDKLLLSTHAYSPYLFAMSDATDNIFGDDDKGSLDYIFNYLKTAYTDKGIGVVMGEASASDKDNTAERVKWTTYYFTKAREAGIPVVLWDNMVIVQTGGNINSGECHGYYNRNTNKWFFPEIMEAMMNAAYNR